MRTATVTRATAETDITVEINLDGTGRYDNQTGVGFFDHMLDQLARHALIDMSVRAKGDLHIDDHHTVEDTGIALGQALAQAVGDKRGIRRYGECHLAMDDAQVRCALDLSARPFLICNLDIPALVDYDSGNLHSAQKAFERMASEVGGGDIIVTSAPDDVARADRVVLPGDGAFPACRNALTRDRAALYEAIVEAATVKARPFMGICVGMQMMASVGHEYENTPGFDWIGGDTMIGTQFHPEKSQSTGLRMIANFLKWAP